MKAGLVSSHAMTVIGFFVVLMMCGATGCGGRQKQAEERELAKVPVVQPTVNKKSVDVPVQLTILLDSTIEDIVKLPGPWGQMQFDDYRNALVESLKYAFAGNFQQINTTDASVTTGYVLKVQRAEMQQTTTIRYHALLSYNGEEFIDVSGETQGRTIVAGGFYGSGAKKAQETLMQEALSKMCEGIYDGIFRNEDLGFNFWKEDAPHLKAAAGAPPAEGGAEGSDGAAEEGGNASADADAAKSEG